MVLPPPSLMRAAANRAGVSRKKLVLAGGDDGRQTVDWLKAAPSSRLEIRGSESGSKQLTGKYAAVESRTLPDKLAADLIQCCDAQIPDRIMPRGPSRRLAIGVPRCRLGGLALFF
jgi:hypothetical protein